MASGDRINVGSKDYMPILKVGAQATATANTYTKILDISGAGFLSKVIFNSNNASYTASLKVTIDGVLLYYGTTTDATYFLGFVLESHVTYQNGYTNPSIRISNTLGYMKNVIPVQLPYTDGALNAGISYLELPISFKKSATIEVTSNSVSGTVPYSIIGGLEA